jgi:hypothetical protein
MFDDLFVFNKERSPLQALGFYIVFFIIVLVLAMFAALIFAIDFESGAIVGNVIAVIYCLILGYQILSAKNQLSSAFTAFLFITAFLSYFLGALGGLIPVAYLSTIKNLKS